MDALRARLGLYYELTDSDWQSFDNLERSEVTFPPGAAVVEVGTRADFVFILRSGWALRTRRLEDGRRQITNFMLPGDVFDLQALGDLKADHSIHTVTPVNADRLDANDFLNVMRQSGSIASAFWWAAVQEESILREQIVRIGRRSARERIGHLLLELQHRLKSCVADGEALPLPVSRQDLADALGLTPVHVSRTMSALKDAGLIQEERGVLRILDHEKLAQLAHYDEDYLHLRKRMNR